MIQTLVMKKKIRVVLVEDNEDERMFMKEGFLQTGLYDIVGEAENGDEMLGLLNSTPSLPDVIISDLNMPVRNGYEVIMDTKTNSSLSHIPVIILTTAPLKPYADRCIKLGACAYYTKPDTFLEYKEFAEKIYGDVTECLGSGNVDYSSLGTWLKHGFTFTRNLFYNAAKAIVSFRQQQFAR